MTTVRDCKVNHGFERTFASSEGANRKQNYNHAPECSARDFNIDNIREIKSQVYDKRQTAYSSWEILRIEHKQVKTAQNNSYG